MIEYYKTSHEVAADGTKVPFTGRVDAPVRGCWISVVAPTQEERRWMLEELHVNPEFVTSALDDEETSRVDLDAETGQALVIVDCPFVEDEREAVDPSIVQYDTHPLAVLFLPEQDTIMTVSLKPNATVDAVAGGRIAGVNTAQRTRLLLQMLLFISRRYQADLRSVNRQFRENERKLRRSMRNADLIKMLGFEKSLVYFSTSLKALDATVRRIGYGRTVRLYEDDRDLLDDVSIEIRQAIEMCGIYTEVFNETMDTFGSLINNNLNLTMRTLAIITLVLSMPTMVFSFYGMNTALPLDEAWVFPLVLSIVLSVVAAVWIMRSRLIK
ncbi:magnesium transporter CorA family protein [Parafannyhessea umbonata]|nr:magnesium transporter CorA family protein [Parafannyhessea umbonata]MCI6681143.1 magnesium transporter CorA family protein [Parafannyhessea umbonata]MDD7199776.1 magnesium transporter CorA family protein [Parafannyhessea umbonata]MDY4014248.1 magnesium transporter CorA family protein [Parafannyhessea umbonata]MDY4418777.1 magnesium transporter CorA family protein [Parafannyhessea umbonata]